MNEAGIARSKVVWAQDIYRGDPDPRVMMRSAGCRWCPNPTHYSTATHTLAAVAPFSKDIAVAAHHTQLLAAISHSRTHQTLAEKPAAAAPLSKKKSCMPLWSISIFLLFACMRYMPRASRDKRIPARRCGNLTLDQDSGCRPAAGALASRSPAGGGDTWHPRPVRSSSLLL